MRARSILGLVVMSAAAGCTSLLGTFDVGSGSGTDGGGTDGPLQEGSTTDGSTTDAPLDSPPDAGCMPPRPTQCGTACVNLELDEKNCGACGRGCLGGMCVAKACLPTLLSARTDVVALTLAANETDVFYATTAGDVFQQPLMGGGAGLPAPIRLASPGDVFAIATLGTDVFFTMLPAAGQWQLWKASAGVAGSGTPRNGAMSGRPVGLVAVPTAGNVFTQSIALAAPTETFQIATCSNPAGSACFTNYPGQRPGTRIVAGNGFVFWTDQYGKVNETADGVGLLNVISSASETAIGAAWDGANLFWGVLNANPNKIRRSPYPNPSPADARALVGVGLNDMVVDGTSFYYAQNDASGTDVLYAAPKTGAGAPNRIASGTIAYLAQNSQAIFWADGAGIHAVRKP